jgi:hypothetical protein
MLTVRKKRVLNEAAVIRTILLQFCPPLGMAEVLVQEMVWEIQSRSGGYLFI